MDMLARIEVRPIQRPVYNNTQIRDYARWLENNQQSLAEYWNTLVSEDGLGPLGEDDFFLFCVCQHDFERDRMEELKRCYNTWGNEQ